MYQTNRREENRTVHQLNWLTAKSVVKPTRAQEHVRCTEQNRLSLQAAQAHLSSRRTLHKSVQRSAV